MWNMVLDHPLRSIMCVGVVLFVILFVSIMKWD